MATDISAPFGPTDLESLNEQLKSLDDADRLIAKASQAGMDVSVQKKEAQELRLKLLRIKQTFFPGR